MSGLNVQSPEDQSSTHLGLNCELDQLDKLKGAAETHMHFSELYLPLLRIMTHSFGTENNISPWKTLKEGSYYLKNANDLVEMYKDCVPGPIQNNHIQAVNCMLVALEFDPKHITSGCSEEANSEEAECFVSKGQGTKYYKMLHSNLKRDIRSFIEFVELNIDIPVKQLLESINLRIQSAPKDKGVISNNLKPMSKLDQLKQLKGSAELHIRFSNMYLPMLRNMSHPNQPKNCSPWKAVKEGSYFLGNAFDLVERYKAYVNGSIDDSNIQKVNEILIELEFDRKHITSGYTDEAYGGTAECFVSKGQGTKYYNLLHSKFSKDVRAYIEIAERRIDIPIKNFLETVKQRIQSSPEN